MRVCVHEFVSAFHSTDAGRAGEESSFINSLIELHGPDPLLVFHQSESSVNHRNKPTTDTCTGRGDPAAPSHTVCCRARVTLLKNAVLMAAVATDGRGLFTVVSSPFFVFSYCADCVTQSKQEE